MFTLDFDIPDSDKKIGLGDSICLIGSCFSDEMGVILNDHKFNCLSNPFGTIYNPYSIFKLITDRVSDDEIIESQGVFYHWDAHGAVSGLSKDDVIAEFQERRKKTQQFLAKANWLIITLGTSFVYEHSEVGIVGNCHKIPASSFTKRLLTQTEITDQFTILLSHLEKINPAINILFTVSPVRHIRDGLVENNRSKAILIDAIHGLCERHQNVEYFPSYEILIDQLRDYRFYADDMIHPSTAAIDFIWRKFGAVYFNNETKNLVKEWASLRSAIHHKSFQPESASHQKFLIKTLDKANKLNEKIDLSVEIKQLKDQMK